jgi:hypothetical protein
MDADRRFLALAGAQTLLVATVAGIAGALVLFSPLGGVGLSYLLVDRSGTGARLTYRVLEALTVVVLALYVLVPVGIAGSLVRDGDGRPVVLAGAAALAVFGLPAALVGPGWVAGLGGNAALVAGVVAVVVLLAAAVLAVRRGVPAATFANVALLFVFAVGLFVTPLALAGPAEGFVEQRGGIPQTAFAYDYEPAGDGRGVLTVVHEGGDAVRADALSIESEDLADVAGAEQTEPGPWQGETSAVDGTDGSVVAEGDSVTVGVEGDCVVRVAYRRGVSSTVGKFTCPDAG